MTKRFLPLLVITLACLTVFGSQRAFAQYPYVRPPTSPYFRPPISPYLNLLRGGNSAAVNYYTGVLPEQQLYKAFQQLNQQVATNQMQLNEMEGQAGESPTGHPAYFMNISHYYLSGPSQHAQTRSSTSPSTGAVARPQTRNSGSSFVPRH